MFKLNLTNQSDNTAEGSSTAGTKCVKGLLLSAITLATIIGNSLSLLALILTKKWHTRYLIVSLATTDLLLGTFVMPFATITAVENQWIFSQFWCESQGSFGFLLCQVSVITITCVSVERYILFQHSSLHFKWVQSGLKLMKWLVIATWFYGGLWTFIAWQVVQFSYQRELINCAVVWRQNHHFTIVCGVITIGVPFAVIFYCNFRVTLKVRKMLNRINLTRTRSDSDAIKSHIAEVKISRMLLAVTIAFLACWAPYSIAGLCYILPECNWHEEFFVASVMCCLFNSAINPVLYGTFDRRFRRALTFIFLKLLRITGAGKVVSRMTAINMSPTAAQQVAAEENREET